MKITRFFLATALIMGGIKVQAQLSLGGHFYGEDAFRYTQSKVTGSARMQGMGGSYAALGADASNAFSNPAGLGFYNRSELSITPIFNSLNTSSQYIGSTSKSSTSNANIGQLGLILSNSGNGSRKKRSAFAITYSKQVNLLSSFNYVGQNNKSSMGNYFTEKVNSLNVSAKDLDKEFDANTATADYPEGMYYWSYMIDPVAGNDTKYLQAEKSLPVNQIGNNTSTGNQSQWNMAYGANFDDKVYLGFSLGFVRMNYENLNNHNEQFPKGTVFNGFDYNENLTSRGGGMNVGLGAIVKVADNINLGVNVTSPTWLTINEVYNSNIRITTTFFKPDYTEVRTRENEFSYKITTPLKASGGVTFFLPSKKGFITADAEYVGYSNMGIKYANYDNNGYVTGYSTAAAQNTKIKNTYKDAVNIKVGGEYRIENIRLRLGAKYMPDPYTKKIDNLDRSQMVFTGGVGYRSAKFFVDVAGVLNQFTSAYTPYELANTANYASANITNNHKSFVISVGTFF
ncbi:hypothetical protein Emtol_3855 [Emticicia oligotrophica DSM 17448]|uniref:Outer membrane protein transport protein (OMPP1/FadL/TodX) n=1 Tax=Emticicia oligotrophica (strain DSM 17448 / CIP 109782 / MTCC 6937 / GPTSA100-15) TaxID=929562 RepID=A0ABN4ATZ1_EMTOG|nr:hypothetical protein [Emticicia oligotrophica]AFK04981.1 hypothetical protein Emtol_3855 [Emticicia oligotrophica DSM 17448]